jgi:hypothetical protein
MKTIARVYDTYGQARQVVQPSWAHPGGHAFLFFRQIERRKLVPLKTEAGRALLAAKLQDAVKPSDPSSVQNAPAAQVSSKS